MNTLDEVLNTLGPDIKELLDKEELRNPGFIKNVNDVTVLLAKVIKLVYKDAQNKFDASLEYIEWQLKNLE
jgi:hypothetical protein